jgi:DNA-directed RNA polymerase specialized sigma24 family protein
MNEEIRRRIRTVFGAAADLPQAERGAYLDIACRGERELRAEVESLLEYDSDLETGGTHEGFLKSPLLRTGDRTLRVQEALSSLDPIDREVLVLRHFKKLGRAEAAQVLGISQEAGAKHYFHALERLKDVLAAMARGGDDC